MRGRSHPHKSSHIHSCDLTSTLVISQPSMRSHIHISRPHIWSHFHTIMIISKINSKGTAFSPIYILFHYIIYCFIWKPGLKLTRHWATQKAPSRSGTIHTDWLTNRLCKHQNFSPPFYTKCIKIQLPLNVVYSSYIKCYFVFQVSFAFEDWIEIAYSRQFL